MSRSYWNLAALWLAAGAIAHAQVSTNASLTGAYYFRHVLVVTDGGAGLADTRTTAGTMTFDGRGAFTYTAQQLVKTTAPVAASGSGTYAVKAGGVTSLTSSLFGAAGLNARLVAKGR